MTLDEPAHHLRDGFNGTVVDIGCGTGTFAIALASQRADARVIGIDGDSQILEMAQRKPAADAVEWCRRAAAGPARA
jgi:release factor glutamine methyltransferase